jgi:ubiquinone/menaquinone biosynthesis C-methylase UbiE
LETDSLKEISLKTRSSYNLAAEKYHQLFYDELEKKEFDRKILDEFSNFFDKDSLLCDAGCGPSGHITGYIFKKGIKIIGIDISDKCIEVARKENPRIKFERGDISELNCKNDYFDGIISYYSIINTPKKFVPRIMSEFKRILKPGGYLLLAVKAGKEEGFLSDLLGIKTKIYFTLFSEEEIRNYVKESGFEMKKFEIRKPYDFEIQNDRIYAVCMKASA